jgi:hypothetical protein
MKRTGTMTLLRSCWVVAATCALAVSCSKSKPSFEQASRTAFEVIQSRAVWPESPEALCKTFWTARAGKNYEELKVLWPGSASFDWEAISHGDDRSVTYVFGPAKDHAVPYASEAYYRQHGAYNLTMRLGSLETSRGKRYYIVSGD